MNPRHVILLFGALTWFGAIYWLAASGAFVSSRHERPVTLAVAFLTPILLFLVGVRLPGWRSLVVSIPPVFLIALNGWRFIGLGFLMAYREGLLPGGFAWPAGLGDIAMAVTAPWIAARVAGDDRFRFSKTFLVLEPAWHRRFRQRSPPRHALPVAGICLFDKYSAHATPPVRADPLLLCAIGGYGAYRSLGRAARKTE